MLPAVTVVLPEGFVIPPLAYLVTLVAVALAVTVLLFSLRPVVTPRTILALAAWMYVGAGLHALFVLGAVDPLVAPLLGTPAVYITTYVVAGAVWAGLRIVAASRPAERRIDRRLGLVGLLAALAVTAAVLLAGQVTAGRLFWTVVTVLAAIVIWAVAWLAVSLFMTPVVAKTGTVGALVVFSHVLDGMSTAVGIDVFGGQERSPVPRAILSIAESLPTAGTVGTGWLFVLVKLLIAAVVVVLFADYVEDRPAEALLLLGLIAAVGLGPGVHNLLLLLAGG